MSGIEFYDVSGYIDSDTGNGVGGTKMEGSFSLPTAPMYRDGKSYNGKCAVWLKSVVLDGFNNDNQLNLRTTLEHASSLGLVLSTPSLNQLPLLVNKGQVFPGGSVNPPIQADTKIQTSFGGSQPVILEFFPNTKPLVLTHTHGLEVGDTLSTVATGTGDGSAGNYPAYREFLGSQFHFKTIYDNPNVGDMAYASICNNLWGSELDVALVKHYVAHSKSGIWLNATGLDNPVYFVLTIKPLTNDPVYNGMPEDDKQRL